MRWGLIGASYVAATRTGPALRQTGGEIVGVYDPDLARLDYWPDLAVRTSDLGELLSAGLDAVYISTRNEDHAEQAIAALGAGLHVLCEKPMALTVADCDQMIAAADEAGKLLAVNHHLPGSPLHEAVRALVHQGRIGPLLAARINHAVLLPEHLRTWRVDASAGAGVTLDITCHDASVLNPLFGTEPLRVSALGVRQASWNSGSTPDAVMTVIEYAAGEDGRGLIAQTHDAFSTPFPHTYLEVMGESGAIRVQDGMTQDTPGTVTLIDEAGEHPVEVDCSEDLYVIIARAFVAAVAGTGRPTATAEEGRRNLQVALAAQQALVEQRVVEISQG